jgi:DNA-binding phage protein
MATKADTYIPSYTDFDHFLESRGLKSKVKAAVEKRIVAYLLEERRVALKLSKAELARTVGTSRTQIDRVLDPKSQNITLETLNRVAFAMGKRIHLELVD